MTADSSVDSETGISEEASPSVAAPKIPRPPRPRGVRAARIPLPVPGVSPLSSVGPSGSFSGEGSSTEAVSSSEPSGGGEAGDASSSGVAKSGIASVDANQPMGAYVDDEPVEARPDSLLTSDGCSAAGQSAAGQMVPPPPSEPGSMDALQPDTPSPFESVVPAPSHAPGRGASHAESLEASPAVSYDDDLEEQDDTVVGDIPEGLIAMSLAPPAMEAGANEAETCAFTAPKELLELAKRKREERLAARQATAGEAAGEAGEAAGEAGRTTVPSPSTTEALVEGQAVLERAPSVANEEGEPQDVGLSEPTRAVAPDFAARSFAAADLAELKNQGAFPEAAPPRTEPPQAEPTQLSATEEGRLASTRGENAEDDSARTAWDTINTEEAPPVPADSVRTGLSVAAAASPRRLRGAPLWIAIGGVCLALGYAIATFLPP